MSGNGLAEFSAAATAFAAIATAVAAGVTAWMAKSTRSMAEQAKRSANASVDAVKNAEQELELLRKQYELAARERADRVAPVLIPDRIAGRIVPGGVPGPRVELQLKNIGNGPAILSHGRLGDATDKFGAHVSGRGGPLAPYLITATWSPQIAVLGVGETCVFEATVSTEWNLWDQYIVAAGYTGSARVDVGYADLGGELLHVRFDIEFAAPGSHYFVPLNVVHDGYNWS